MGKKQSRQFTETLEGKDYTVPNNFILLRYVGSGSYGDCVCAGILEVDGNNNYVRNKRTGMP